MKKGFRNSTNEEICTDWRNRAAQFWDDDSAKPSEQYNNMTATESIDPELHGTLDRQNIYELLVKAFQQNTEREKDVRSIQELFWTNIPEDFTTENTTSQQINHTEAVFDVNSNPSKLETISLVQISKSIRNYKHMKQEAASTEKRSMIVHDPLASMVTELPPATNFSNQQASVFNSILTSINNNTQTLTIVHGGGGTGKSFLINCICAELQRRHFQVVSTCPTGAGACQLPQGRTFHSAFKINSKQLSAAAKKYLRQLFNDRVRLVVVDEMSMLKAQFVQLLDSRLRMLYNPNKPFGDKTILMVRTNT